jgi:hypothetical protein
MSVAARPDTAGKTRTCPHCKATILESLSICPGCLHHLRFDQEGAKRQVAAASALRVEGVITHPPATEPWEYFVVIAVRNDRGEEVARQVVNVGALHNTEKRTFTLSVETMPLQPRVAVNKPAAAPAPGAVARAPAGAASSATAKATTSAPAAAGAKPAAGASPGTPKTTAGTPPPTTPPGPGAPKR